MVNRPVTLVRGSCHHDCPDTCVWEVGVREGRAVTLRGAAEHPTTQGALCPKVNRYLDRVYGPGRLLHPLRRVGAKGSGQFTQISWTEALGEIADRMGALRDAGKAESILQYSFAGTQGVVQSGVVADAFFDALGSSDIRRHLCGATASMGAADVLGEPFGMDPLDLRHARTIVLWGTDTLVTNRHLWQTITDARAQGAKLIVVDPLRTATAAKADQHLPLRPGTDVALVLGLLHVAERDGLLDQPWLETRLAGWNSLRENVIAASLPAIADATGLTTEEITVLAHRLIRDQPSAIRTLLGAEHRRHGRDIMRAIATLAAVLGLPRQRGGGLARSTQVYFDTCLQLPTRSRARRRFNMARLGALLTDEAPEPGIELLVVHNCNPAVTVPDQNRIIAGLERQDLFTVVLEQVMTDTARYADLVLPVTTQLEHLDLGLAWGHLFLSLNRPAIAPRGEALPNTEIFRRLAAALGLDADPWLHEDDEALIRRVLSSNHPWLKEMDHDQLHRLGWARLAVAAVPEPARYRVAPLEFFPPGHDRSAAEQQRHPLLLQTRKQHIGFLNAHYGADPAHQPRHGEFRVTLHPHDAQARGIQVGDLVLIENDRGRLTALAQVDETTQPGMVTVPFGWWHQAAPEQRSVNALTNPSVPDDDHGSAAFHDTWVEVIAGCAVNPKHDTWDPRRS